MTKLLSWPKAPKSLRYGLQLSQRHIKSFETNKVWSIDNSGLFEYDAKSFSEALKSQGYSLEELIIDGAVDGDSSAGFEPTEIIDLHLSTNLSYVELSVRLLVISRQDAVHRGIRTYRHSISDPPARSREAANRDARQLGR